MNARHRADFLAHFRAGTDEHGIDKAGGGEACFAHQAAQGFGAAESPRAMRGKAHRCFAPAGKLCPEFTKKVARDSRMAVTEVSEATISLCTPASRRALSVTGPIAAKALFSARS